MYCSESELDKGIASLAIEGIPVSKSEREFARKYIEKGLDSDDLVKDLTIYYKSYSLGMDPSKVESLIKSYSFITNTDCIEDIQRHFIEPNKNTENSQDRIFTYLETILCSVSIAIIDEIIIDYSNFSIKNKKNTNLSTINLLNKTITTIADKYV